MIRSTKKDQGLELARLVIRSIVPIAQLKGEPLSSKGGICGQVLVANGLQITYVPAICVTPGGTMSSLVDIWPQGGRKVFSIGWDPLVVVTYKPGPWVGALRSLAATSASETEAARTEFAKNMAEALESHRVGLTGQE
jgi:hypothetical protein